MHTGSSGALTQLKCGAEEVAAALWRRERYGNPPMAALVGGLRAWRVRSLRFFSTLSFFLAKRVGVAALVATSDRLARPGGSRFPCGRGSSGHRTRSLPWPKDSDLQRVVR